MTSGQGSGRARQAAWLLIAAGLFTIANDYLPGAGQLNVAVLNLIGVAAVTLGLVAHVLPWHRWPQKAPIVVAPIANRFGGVSHYSFGVYFVLAFTWVGLAFPPKTSLLLAPFATLAYVLPGLTTAHGPAGSVSSVTVAIPVCLLVGETIARTMKKVTDAGAQATEKQAQFERLVAKARQRDADLREAEEQFRLAFANAPIGMSLTSLDGRFLQVNEALCQMLGRSEGELVGAPVASLTYPDDQAADRAAMGEMRTGTRRTFHTEKRYLRPDGQPVWVRLHAGVVRDEDGRPRHFVSQMEDITERKRTEAALRAGEERTRRILETAGDAFVAIDQAGRITDWNRQAEETFGWPAIDVLGRPLDEVLIPAEMRSAHGHGLARFLATGEGPVLGQRVRDQQRADPAFNARRWRRSWRGLRWWTT